jgi:DNA-binding CsgD family transcriptional regulator
MQVATTHNSAELIRKIYGTVTNSAAWDGLLTDIAESFQSSASFVCARRAGNSEPSGLFLAHGVEHQYFEQYRSHYHEHDILLDASSQKPPNVLYANQDLCKDSTYLASEIYNVLCRPQDFRYNIVGTLADSFGDVEIDFGLIRGHGAKEFSTQEALAASSIMPHINRSLALAYQLSDGNDLTRQDSYAVLDHLEEGVVICGADGKIHYQNLSFDQISLETHLFRADRNQQLIFRNQKNHNIFKELVRDVLSPVTGSLHTPYSDTACVMDGEQRYLIKIRPWLDNQASLWGTQSEPRYLLFIREAGSKRVPSARRIAALHPLTRSESEISHYLCHGMAADEIARTRTVAASTVRQQIKAMMRKLNCHKQGELVAYLLTNTLM